MPYLRATSKHGDGFQSLLWASPASQAARFAAICRLCNFSDLNVLDVGCGRADLLDYLRDHGRTPAHYVGIEAVDELAGAAQRKRHPACTIVQADFIASPARMLVGADAIVFCGSLNTLDRAAFHQTIRTAYAAAAHYLLFNFLSSRLLAN